ncbi:MAG: hypothetical protein HQL32_16920 [Planctomycetes bacterium]|nr:hypothetical protein [Planctomycetota bacterium]
MTKKTLHWSATLLIIGLSLYLTGCSSTNNLDNIDVRKKSLYSKMKFGSTWIRQESDGVVITGVVQKRGISISSRGHVDIIAKAQNGDILASCTVSHRPIISRKNKNGVRFIAKLPIQLPKDAIIDIQYHKPEYKKVSSTVTCKRLDAMSTQVPTTSEAN